MDDHEPAEVPAPGDLGGGQQGAALSARLTAYLEQTHGKLVLDMAKVRSLEEAAAKDLCDKLQAYRSRVVISLPSGAHAAQFLLLTGIFKTYQG